ncbi:MAG: hypothetical protein DRR06_17620 [Gammaproteobacteria bacterium]|nr:MAG: hypothetical protein DRR06_17620 [Gammaproteobacteria bacterium]
MNVLNKIINNPLLSVGHRLTLDIESTFPNTEALIVGGCVRDLIMDIEPHDVDIATNADIDKIAEHYHSANIGQSKDFGIVLVLFEGQEFEVAHYREEFGSEDNRHPDEVVQVNDFASDTARRDITINSLGIDTSGEVIDHQGGIQDIANGVIKAVGNPNDRFKEDALRIIRVARFAARFGFGIHGETIFAMFTNRELTRTLSVERIRDEMIKAASYGGRVLRSFLKTLDAAQVLDIHLPEINTFHGFKHGVKYHPEGDLYAHTMAALIVSQSNDPLTNISILFHDIGKTVTQAFDEEGKVSYKGHDSVGAEMFEEIGKRLKFSNDQIEAIQFGIKHHMVAHDFRKMKKSKIVEFRQSKHFPLLKAVARADDAARLHLFDEDSFNATMEHVENVFKVFGEKKEFEARMTPLINGRMIMNLAEDEGFTIEGKRIGQIKNTVREIIIEKEFDITLQDTSRMVRELVKVKWEE